MAARPPTLLDAVDAAMFELGWDSRSGIAGGMRLVETDVDAGGATLRCQLYLFEEAGQIAVATIVLETVPAERRPAVDRLIARANWGLVVGNLELDGDSGAVRVRSGIAFDGAEPPPARLLAATLRANVEVARRARGPVADVALAGRDPQEAVDAFFAAIERPSVRDPA